MSLGPGIDTISNRCQPPLYPVAFAFDTGFGRCVGVDLAAALAADPSSLMALLHSEEQPLGSRMRGARLVEFIGGRVASRLARDGMPGADGPTLRNATGAPIVADGVSVSISHARRFAVALACARSGCCIGVDVEPLDEEHPNPLLAERILSDCERTADRTGKPIPILRRLSLKEAAYKALLPRFGHLPLREIPVLRCHRDGSGYCIVPPAIGDRITAASRDFGQHAVSLVRVAGPG